LQFERVLSDLTREKASQAKATKQALDRLAASMGPLIEESIQRHMQSTVLPRLELSITSGLQRIQSAMMAEVRSLRGDVDWGSPSRRFRSRSSSN
jgi:hypothetical protein